MTIDKQVLRQIAESVDREEWCVLDNGDADYQVIVSGSLERGATYRSYQPVTNEISNKKIAAFIAAFNPKVALALLNEVEAAEHTAAVDHEAACSLVEENETLKRRIAEQREYYEGVIADGSKRTAELEARTVTLPDRKSEIFWPGDAYEFDSLGYVIAVKSAIHAAGIQIIEEGKTDGQ
ncbi:ead/Ea22-like family protein [Salmonella enterica]|uniref:ead/Ea22-like family protein n=1 Tax=Salmonella enterica TaxID=28901 RepID=UPI003D3204E4